MDRLVAVGTNRPADTLARMDGHLKVKKLMENGAYDEALSQIQRVQDLYGTHVGLQADMGVCYYHLGDTVRWHHSLQELTKDFDDNREALSITSRLRTSLILAKYHEEQGELLLALNTLHREEYSVIHQLSDKDMRLKFLANLLRLQSLMGISGGKSQLVQALEADKNGCPEDICIEVEHALMLWNLEHFGTQKAMTCLKLLLEKKQLSDYDRELVIFDFVECCLSFDYTLDCIFEIEESLRKNINSQFSILLARFLIDDDYRWLWNSGPENRPLTSGEFIRLSMIYIKKSKVEDVAEVAKMLDDLLLGLSWESRLFWQRRSHRNTMSWVLIWDRSSETLSTKENLMSFEGKPVVQDFLNLLTRQPIWFLEDLSRLMFSCEYSEDTYHRIRIMVMRLNRILFQKFSIPKGISLNRTTLCISQDLTFKEPRP